MFLFGRVAVPYAYGVCMCHSLQPISECESVDALVRTDLDAIAKDSDDTVKVRN